MYIWIVQFCAGVSESRQHHPVEARPAGGGCEETYVGPYHLEVTSCQTCIRGKLLNGTQQPEKMHKTFTKSILV